MVASWNVRTIQDTGLGARRRTTVIACELARYNIDIAALSETRLPDEGSLVEIGTGNTFFLIGLPTVARRIHCAGFVVRTAPLQSTQESPIVINERLMTLWLPLAKNRLAQIWLPPIFIAILRQFLTVMCAQVVMAGSQSSSFPVEVGVKQGCVLAPIIFNLLLVAITLVSHRDLQSSDCGGT